MARKKIDFDVVRAIALKLPGVEESSLHGAPSLKAAGRLLACPALHKSAEPNSIAVRIGFEQRAALMQENQLAYYVTEHYVHHPVVLVRPDRIDRNALDRLIGMAWEFVTANRRASKRTVRRGKD